MRGVPKNHISPGHVCGEAARDPPSEAKSFTAQLVVLEHPGEITCVLSLVLMCAELTFILCNFRTHQSWIRAGN